MMCQSVYHFVTEMLVTLSPTFVTSAKIIFGDNFRSPVKLRCLRTNCIR